MKKYPLGLTDIFLLAIILLNVLDFFEIIPSELDYVKKIISWTLLGYLLYQASPSLVFFGEKHKGMDTGIILAYFLLIFKELIWYAYVMVQENSIQGTTSLLQPFFSFLVIHGGIIETSAFLFGMSMLACICFFVTYKVSFHKKSIMGVLHEEGEPVAKKSIERFFMTLIVLLGFFVIVFNMMMEWLAIAIDATLLLIALLFWSVILIRHKVSLHKFLDNVGNIGADFYEWFIDHFRYKETFFLGIVGLLVLHLLTDIGIFLIPYLTGIKDILYLNSIILSFDSVWQVLLFDWSALSLVVEKGAYIVTFIANIVGFLILFISPAIIWRSLYHRKRPNLPSWLTISFFASLPAIVLAPLFRISRIENESLAGVNVQLQSLQATPIVIICILMVIFGVSTALLIRNKKSNNHFQEVWTSVSSIFFIKYIWNYFIDVASKQQIIIQQLLLQKSYILGATFFIFLSITILFYVGGSFLLFYELVHRTKHKK